MGMSTVKNHKTEPTVGFRKYNYGKDRKLRYSKITQDNENRSKILFLVWETFQNIATPKNKEWP